MIVFTILWFVFGLLVVLFLAVGLHEPATKLIICFLGVSKKYEAMKWLGFSMAGVLAVLQALASHRRAKAMEDTNVHTEEGQRQERLRNAIEHLGHESASVRLGGVYELVLLARNSRESRKIVLDILCAHVRRITREDKYRKEYKSKPSEEIQSLLSLIFVQEREIFKDLKSNLNGSWLNGAILNGAQMQRIILHEAHMQGAELKKAHLQGAVLDGAQMQRTILRGAHMQGAKFYFAHLQESKLEKAHLQGAVFHGTNMQLTILNETQMQGAVLSGVQMQGAEFNRTKMQGVTSNDDQADFSKSIKASIGRQSDFSGVTFKGGLGQGDVDLIIESYLDDEKSALKRSILKEKLEPHIYKLPNHKPPKGSGVIIGTYTEEEARRWIAEYNNYADDPGGR